MPLRSIFLCFVCFVIFAGSSPAQSGRTKPTPTPTPNSISGPSALSTPRPTPVPPPLPAATPKLDDDVIRVQSVLVPIPMIALDPFGRAVTTLKASDLELRIDGKVEEIDGLARSETPLRLVMLFDNSSSVSFVREFEIAAAVKFFRRVIRPDRDMAALFSVSDTIVLEQPLTRDVGQIVRTIESFPKPQGATALLDGIVRAAAYLRGTDGRRVIVIVSDGEDTYSDTRTTLESVVRALQENDCQVYVVKTKEFENFKRTGVRGGNANIRSLIAERRMAEITAQTGGAVYSPIDEREMDDAFERIYAELSQQYIISYYPDEETAAAGTYRRIEVTSPTRKDLTIRTRKGYYVTRK